MICKDCKFYRYLPATYWDPAEEYCTHPKTDTEWCCDEDGNELEECELFEEAPLPEY